MMLLSNMQLNSVLFHVALLIAQIDTLTLSTKCKKKHTTSKKQWCSVFFCFLVKFLILNVGVFSVLVIASDVFKFFFHALNKSICFLFVDGGSIIYCPRHNAVPDTSASTSTNNYYWKEHFSKIKNELLVLGSIVEDQQLLDAKLQGIVFSNAQGHTLVLRKVMHTLSFNNTFPVI